MKKTLTFTAGFLLTILIQAQPGPPFEDRNLNHPGFPVDGYGPHITRHYYIDSTTLESSYAHLEQLSGWDEIDLRLDHIPAGLIQHGHYIRRINIQHPRPRYSNGKQLPPQESLYDLELLNYLPALEQVYISGYRIDHRPDSIAKTLAQCSGTLVSVRDQARPEKSVFGLEGTPSLFPYSPTHLGMSDVIIDRFPSSLCVRSVSLGNIIVNDTSGIQQNNHIKVVSLTQYDELPGWLPPAIEFLSVNNCDSLTSVQNIERYKNLQSISIRDCFRLDTFPKFISAKKLQRLVVQLHPRYAPDLMAVLTGTDTIQEMELEFYEGVAEMDFKNMSLHVNRLHIHGSSFRQTEIKLAYLENLSAGSFCLSGTFHTIPDVSVMRKLDEFQFSSYIPITDKMSVRQLSKIKNLKRFTLRNYRLPTFPEIFFENNPHLTHLAFIGTDIKKLSFGNTVLTDLKEIFMRENPYLKSIPSKKYYPNAYAPNIRKTYDR